MINMPAIGDLARSKKRRANKALAGLSSDRRKTRARMDPDEAIGLVCECRSAGCVALVWLAAGEFRLLIDAGEASVVAPGHAATDEHVVAASAGYQFVVLLDHVTVTDEAVSAQTAA